MSIEPVKNKNPTEYDGINNTRNQPGGDNVTYINALQYVCLTTLLPMDSLALPKVGADSGQDRGSVELVAPQAVKESEGLEKQNGSGPPVSPFASTIEAHSELPQLKVPYSVNDACHYSCRTMA